MNSSNFKYFLATNSCEGFISSFKSAYNPKDGWKSYIIKGGPGTGKSSFMKFLSVKAAEKNIKTLLCPCSSDPDSLDAVIFPEEKIIVMDGTSPHTVDPTYPAVCEEILNFGEFWSNDKFHGSFDEIIRLTDKNKSLHKTASRYLQAVGQLMRDNLKTATSCTDTERAKHFAEKLCKKHIPKHKGTGKEWIRYLCGVTPKGVVSFADTVLAETKNTIIIEDSFGYSTDIIMSRIRDYALSQGYEIITVKNAFLPSLLTDHIIIPELSLSFVRESEYCHFKTDVRRIHARRFLRANKISKSRERIRFNKKAAKQLLLTACTVLSEAKAVHDELEQHYIKAMNFEKLTAFANEFAEKLFD